MSKLKFSEAVMLGSTHIKLSPSKWLDLPVGNSQCGCLMGMGLKAVGYETGGHTEVTAEWPWIINWIPFEQLHPVVKAVFEVAGVNVFDGLVGASAMTYMATLLDQGALTLEEVCDWIRTIEPADVSSEEVAETKEEVLQSA